MTAKELCVSILEHHLKSQLAIWQKSDNEAMRKQGVELYGSLESFTQWMKKHAEGNRAFRLTEKQAAFLSSHMRKEKIERVQFGPFECWPDHKTYPVNAVGGFIGKRKDPNQHILKLRQTI